MNKPFLMKPYGKSTLWGGNRLNEDFNKDMRLHPLSETWECSTHPSGSSIVASGAMKGMKLSDVIRQHPEYLGTHPDNDGDLPILIKFIDARETLSIHVHPSDEYAFVFENGQLGKTEMWYIIDAEKGAQVMLGMEHSTTAETVRKAAEDGTVENLVRKVDAHPDDVFMIKSGTIHAIGAGCLLVEIQENSDLSYRLYDHDREDEQGHKRELQIDKALAVANFNADEDTRQPMRIMRYTRGCARELLVRNKYFETERLLVNTERCREMVPYQSDSLSFRVLLCVGGCGVIFFDEESLPFVRGDCIFVPADSTQIRIHGKAQLLSVRC
jgi:mannose-6-phosphate isomerase class I